MVELEVNPGYYGKEPEIKRIVLKFGGNPVNELLSGNVDAAKDLLPFEILQVANIPRYNLYHEFNVSSIISLLWNHRNPLFRDASVRRALTLAINRRELAQVLNLPEDIPIFDASIVKSQFFRGEVPDPIPHDPELSRRLLDKAGWVEKKAGGIRENNGQKFRFSLLLTEELMPAAVYIQDQFRRVGIDMETVTMEIVAILGRAREGKYEAVLSNAPAFSYGWDYGGYDNPEFALLNKRAFTATSVEELEEIARKLWPIFQSDIPWTFLYPEVTTNAVSKRIKGLTSPHRSDPTRFMEYLWIEEEESEK
jgi:peptide/nickel transport system substrate-binding protein